VRLGKAFAKLVAFHTNGGPKVKAVTPSAVEKAQIERMIGSLRFADVTGSSDEDKTKQKKFEAACAALRKMGPKAIPALDHELLTSKDSVAASAAHGLLKEIESGK